MTGEDGVIRGPAGDGRFAGVAQDDIADVAAAVLLAPEEHARRTYDAGFGAPEWQVEAWVSTYTAVASGELDGVGDAVERIAGHSATSLERLLGELT